VLECVLDVNSAVGSGAKVLKALSDYSATVP
jgi:hypothetical protein